LAGGTIENPIGIIDPEVVLEDFDPNAEPIPLDRKIVEFDSIELNFQAEGSLSSAILDILVLTDISALDLPQSATLVNPEILNAPDASQIGEAENAESVARSEEQGFTIPSGGIVIDGILTFDPASFASDAELTDNVATFLGLLSTLDDMQIDALANAVQLGDPTLRAAIDALTAAELTFLANQEISEALCAALREEETRRLYEGYLQDGANFTTQFGIANGERPTQSQLASLSNPIILMVPNENGDLVPELFRPAGDGLDAVRGAPGSIIAQNVYLTAEGRLINRGGIVANSTLAITAGRVENLGLGINEERGRFRDYAGTIQGGIVSIETTTSDIVNIGGSIQGTQYVSLVSAGDVINQATNVFFTLDQSHGCRGRSCGNQVRDFAMAEISSGGEVYINAANNILNSASYIGGADSVRLIAGNDITNEALSTKFVLRDYKKKKLLGKKIDYAEGAIIAAGIVQSLAGDVILDAGGEINIQGSRVEALSEGGLTYARAGQDIILESIAIELEARTKNSGLFTGGALWSSHSTRSNSFETAIAEVTGFDVELDAGQDIVATGARVSAVNDLTLNAGRDIVSNALEMDRYFEERTFTISVSYPGSNIVEAALSGDLDAVGRAYINSNPFTQSVLALAESDTPFELAANAYNTRNRYYDIGGQQYDAATNNGQNRAGDYDLEAARQSGSDQFNPFSGFDTGRDVTDADGNLLQEGTGTRGFLSNFTVSLSSQRSRSDWTEHEASSFTAGGDFNSNSGRDTLFNGGTQVDVGGNASITALRDIVIEAQANTSSNRSRGWGASLGLRPQGVEIGGSINRSDSDSTTYSGAALNVGGTLTLNTTRDLSLLGATVDVGEDAVVNVGRDLTIQTLQDISESSNLSAGLSVTVGPQGISDASGNFATGNSDSQRSEGGLAALIAGGSLSVDVGGTTSLIGGAIGSETGEMDLTTTELVLQDLVERERSTQVGLNFSTSGNLLGGGGNSAPTEGGTSTDSGGSNFGVTGGGGSFSTSALDGTTRATIGEGTVTVRSQTDAETEAQLGETNRDLDTVTTITRDSSFETGDIFIDVGALSDFKENVAGAREFLRNYEAHSQISQDTHLNQETLLNGIEVHKELSRAGLNFDDASVEEVAAAMIAADRADLIAKFGDTPEAMAEINAALSDPEYLAQREVEAQHAKGQVAILINDTGWVLPNGDIIGGEVVAGVLPGDSTSGTQIDLRDAKVRNAVVAQTDAAVRAEMEGASEADIQTEVEKRVETQFNENVVTSFLGHADTVGDAINELAGTSPVKAYLAAKGVQTTVALATGGSIGRSVQERSARSGWRGYDRGYC